ncbi:MAG: DUF998 domain-containing protein [Ilumatobacter sp.]
MSARLAWGGAIGPAAFVAAWSISAAATDRDDYSPVHDTISQLAAVGANTRPLMTTGMIVFGLALPVYAVALKQTLPGRAWLAATASGVATLGVAATPLHHSELVDRLHEICAAAGYITLTAVPLLARRPLRTMGHRKLAAFGTAVAAVSAVALPTSVLVSQTGFFQRLGLTAGDAFLIASAPVIGSILRRRETKVPGVS